MLPEPRFSIFDSPLTPHVTEIWRAVEHVDPARICLAAARMRSYLEDPAICGMLAGGSRGSDTCALLYLTDAYLRDQVIDSPIYEMDVRDSVKRLLKRIGMVLRNGRGPV